MKKIFSDEELMHALKEKDRKAWRIFHDQRIEKLLNFARRIFNEYNEKDIKAEDLVRVALLELYLNIEQIENIYKAEAYLIKVIKTKSIDKSRQLVNHDKIHNVLKEISPLSEDVIFENLVRTETANAVYKVMNNILSEMNAKILRLSYQNQMSIQEIAQQVELSEEGVKSRKKRAVAQLKEYFKNMNLPLLIAVLLNIIK